MKLWKKATALVLAAVIVVGTPLAAQAESHWIDGNTPEVVKMGDKEVEINNRVTTSAGEILWPSVITDFHATDIPSLIPISPKGVFDMETRASASHYDDAATHVYVANNREYGQLAKAAMNNAINAVGGKLGPSFTLNLFLYEGKAYKPQISTVQEMDFIMQIPKSLREITRDFAVLRLNPDGTISYLTDLDMDPKTITFRTNYFGTYSLYVLAYGGHGCFDAFKPLAVYNAQTAILAQQQAMLLEQQKAAILAQQQAVVLAQQQQAAVLAQQQAALLAQQQQAALLAQQQQAAALLAQQQMAALLAAQQAGVVR